jgi:hypothetical protein
MDIFFDGLKNHIIFLISIIATFCVWPDGFKFLDNFFAMLLKIFLQKIKDLFILFHEIV